MNTFESDSMERVERAGGPAGSVSGQANPEASGRDRKAGPATTISPIATLRSFLQAGLIGHERLIERLLIGILAGGHILVEGAPGLAKTRAVKLLAEAIQGDYARIQCTPDLLPSDVTGTRIYRPETGSFEFSRGPVFHNLILVDEINRAPPKVQSALLEAMAEQQVTSSGDTHRLRDPFVVVATQNPIEHEGTFPLPEAQLDRFLLHVMLHMPDAHNERQILDLVESEACDKHRPPARMTLTDILNAKSAAMATHLAAPLRDYIVRLVMATRTPPFHDEIDHAVSPRGSISLAACAKARAFLSGRDHALPEDVQAVAGDVLAHRMVVSWRATAEGRTARGIVRDIVAQTEPL